MSELPILPLYTDAYIADTAFLTNEQHGIYLRLMMFMWRNGGSLPYDIKRICMMLNITKSKWNKHWNEVLKDLLLIENGEILQKRLQKEYEKALENKHKRAENGRRGGRPKSLKDNNTPKPNGSSSVKLNESETKASISNSISINKKYIKKDFQEFWNACPVQIAQADTEEEYILALEEVEPKYLLKAIKAYAASVEGTDIQYIKQPANWLHDKRYNDKTGFEAVEIDSSAWPDWKRALAVLIGDPEVHSWFSDAETEGNTVYVKNQFTAQWIRNNYDRALAKTLGKQYTIKLLGERAS